MNIISDGDMLVRYKNGGRNKSPVLLDTDVKLGVNCLFVRIKGKSILIDTGSGPFNPDPDKYVLSQPRSLLKGLNEIDITQDQIDIVILTHFHFDHCGGCLTEDHSPVFKNAAHYLHLEEIIEAEKDPELNKYIKIFQNTLGSKNLLHIIEGDRNCISGIELTNYPGHTPGFLNVEFDLDSNNIVFPGDILPTVWHLNNENTLYLDNDPEKLKRSKEDIINKCIENNSVVIFQHALKPTMGRIIRRGERYGFRRIINL